MAKSRNGRKREAVAVLGRSPEVTTLSTRAPLPARRDAISELLGTTAHPALAHPAPNGRRLGWMLGATLLLTAAVFTLLWLQYRSGHATSTNAAVRGHVAEIGTRIGGRIASVAVDVGDRVETGQVLVQLEDRHLLAELEEARAKVAAARVQVEAARRTHAMQRELYEVGGASRAELNGADSERRVREADVLAAQARVTRAETELESAAIRAPQSGAIVRRIVQPGGAVEAGQPVVAMWLGTDVWVEAWIDEEDLGLIRRGGPASVTFHAFPGQEFTGVVERVGLATDLELPDSVVPQPRFARMRTAPVVGVRIRLDAPPPHLLPGLSASVAIRKK